MQQRTTLKSITALVAAVFLGGCGTQPTNQDAAELRKTHGYVVAAIPSVTQEGRPLTVTLRSLSSGIDVQLKPTRGQALAAWVPAGSYEIAEMVGKDKGALPPIQVVPGGSTDLGGLTWASIGARQRVLIPIRHPELSELTASARRPISEHLSSEITDWRITTTPKPQDIPAQSTNLGLVADLITFAAEKANQAPLRDRLRETKNLSDFTRIYSDSAAPLVGEPAFDSRGALYIGSNFGRLRKREPDGRWTAIDTGTMSVLTAVHASANALLVGTADGRLRFSTDSGRTWAPLQKFGERDYVFSIHEHEGKYLVLTGSLASTSYGPFIFGLENLTVHDIHLQSSPQTKPPRTFATSLTLGEPGLSTIYATVAGQQYFVNTFTAIERLDLPSGSWKSVAVPHTVSHLRASTDGKLVTAFKAGGAFSKLSVSSDNGNTWQELETPPYTVIDVKMESISSGTASRWDAGLFASAIQLLNYEKQSKTWSKVWTSAQGTCARTIHVGENKHLCVSNGGSVFRITPTEMIPELVAN